MKTAIVILNWNGRKMLEQYLPSVLEYSCDEATVVVADNASTDDSLTFLNARYPQIQTIVLDQNYGFAEGYNRALKQVEAEYYVLLNSDVEVTPHWLSPLIAYMDSHAEVAACQPKLLSYVNKEKFEYAGASGGYLDRYGYPFCRGRLFDAVETDRGQYDDTAEVLWATGACLFIRSEDYWRVGGLDGRFFAHCEEIDLCWRLNIVGRKVICMPESKVYHLGGGTLPKGNPMKTFLNFRNNLTMLRCRSCQHSAGSCHRRHSCSQTFLPALAVLCQRHPPLLRIALTSDHQHVDKPFVTIVTIGQSIFTRLRRWEEKKG